jgi:ABC-type nickel/cobalt efflux system permease component RcnA
MSWDDVIFRNFAVAFGSIAATLFLTSGQVWQFPFVRGHLLAISVNATAVAVILFAAAETIRLTKSQKSNRTLNFIIIAYLLLAAFFCWNCVQYFDGFASCYNSTKPDIGCNYMISPK